MPNYPIPPWLSPSAAQGYGALAGEASRAALGAEISREKMSQEAATTSMEMQQRSQEDAQRAVIEQTQSAMEAQAKQQQLAQAAQLQKQRLEQAAQLHSETLNQNLLVQAQKIAIDHAYKDSQIGLRQQDNELKQKQFQAKTEEAAKKFTANMAFQKAVQPKDQGGEGLTTTQAALKYMSPYMTGTELGRLSALPGDFKPGNTFAIPNSPESLVQVSPSRWEKYATIPKTITDAPTALPVNDPEGNAVGDVIQIPGQKPIFRGKTSSGDSVENLIKKRQQGKSTAVDTKPQRKAEGGYKIGAVYKGGLRYLGGDPKDQASWEKVKQ